MEGMNTRMQPATMPGRTAGTTTSRRTVNLLIRTVSLRFILRDQGPMNEALISLGLLSSPVEILNTHLAVQIGLFYSYLPYGTPEDRDVGPFDLGRLIAEKAARDKELVIRGQGE